MAKCWEQRGCDGDLLESCPHNVPGDHCPTKCAYAGCERPSYELTTDPELIFAVGIDREQAIREGCTFCAFFLRNGPRLP